MVNVALNAYKMARIVTYEDQAAAEAYPDKGIVAGDSLSDILVKLYYLEPFCTFAAIHKDVDMHVFFDDIQVAARGTRRVVLRNLKAAAKTLKGLISDDLKAVLAIEKATVTATCPKLADLVREGIGAEGGPPVRVAQFLGVDNLLGRRRRVLGKKSKLNQRLTAALARKGRLRRLAMGTTVGAVKIFTAGVQPAAAYGSDVLGVSNTELGKLQSVALASMRPATRGRSRAALFAVKGDPTWSPATAPVQRWAAELWWTQFPRNKAVPCLSIQELNSAMAAAKARPARNWGQVRGAVDAAILSLKRIGWRFKDAANIITDQNVCIPLLQTGPKLFKKQLRDGVQRMWQRKLGESLKKEGWDGARVCTDPAAALGRSAWASHNPLAAFHAVKAFCGGCWTKDRAAKSGYVLPDLLCPLCNEATDTLEHRIFDCKKAAHVRSKFWDTIKKVDARKDLGPLFKTRGIWAHPADACPLPPASGGMDFEWNAAVPEQDRVVDNLGGNLVFVDGSASRHPVVDMRRASWAVAYYDDQGHVQATITGPVWQHLPQTPQSAEYTATVAAIQTMHRDTHLVGDCLGVVRAAQKLKQDLTPMGVHAGLMSDAADPNKIRFLASASWMPSHLTVAENASDKDKLWNEANSYADKLAGDKRLAIEDEIGQDVLKDAADMSKLVTANLRMIGSILSLWPPLPRAVERWNAGPRSRLMLVHDWKHAAARNHWRCAECGIYSPQPLSKGPPTKAGPCRPGRLQERILQAERADHKIDVVYIEGVQTHYCSICGAHGTWLWRKLLGRCAGKPRSQPVRWWLEEACRGGAALRSPPKAKKKAKPKKTMDPFTLIDASPPSRQPTDPLRNNVAASVEDRARWSKPVWGRGCNPEWDSEMDKVSVRKLRVDSQRPDDRRAMTVAQPAPASPTLLLPPASKDSEDDITCIRCSATVLASDDACAQCGLLRAAQQEVSDTVPLSAVTEASTAATSTASTPVLKSALKKDKTRKTKHVKLDPAPRTIIVATYRDIDLWWKASQLTGAPKRPQTSAPASSPTAPHRKVGRPRRIDAAIHPCGSGTGAGENAPAVAPLQVHTWHGGTLVPPPFLTSHFSLNPDTSCPDHDGGKRELSNEQRARLERSRLEASAKREAKQCIQRDVVDGVRRHSILGSDSSAASGVGTLSSPVPSVVVATCGTPAHSRVPTNAEERMVRLAARIRAKEARGD